MNFLSLITRYLNEPFLDEFVNYYLSEGVDQIFVLYDIDSTLPISDQVKQNSYVTIINSLNFKKKQTRDVNEIFLKIKHSFTWVIFCDCDEFIGTVRNKDKTIKEELQTTFKDVDCIKIPWVMMSSNQRLKDPPSILQYLTTRWNHNLKHPHPHKWLKGRCRFHEIEVKCISKCAKIDSLTLHHPVGDNIHVIESVFCNKSELNPFFEKFREFHIQKATMLCYHYRVFSNESAKRKFINNKLDGYKYGNVTCLLESDYSELDDEFMKKKSIAKFGVIN